MHQRRARPLSGYSIARIAPLVNTMSNGEGKGEAWSVREPVNLYLIEAVVFGVVDRLFLDRIDKGNPCGPDALLMDLLQQGQSIPNRKAGAAALQQLLGPLIAVISCHREGSGACRIQQGSIGH